MSNKMFTVASIELGVVSATDKEHALKEYMEGNVSCGHSTQEACLELDDEENKFWGNLTVEKINEMREELSELRAMAKNKIILDYLKKRMVAYIDSGCQTEIGCSDESFKASVKEHGVIMTLEDLEKDMNESDTERFHPEVDMIRFYLT